MDAREVAALLQKDRDEWDALVATLEAHPDEVLHDPESPDWTSRDVYFHLASWMNISTDGLEARLTGREPDPPIPGTDDEINARWRLESEALTLDEARELAHRAFERRLRALAAIEPDRWDATVEEYAHADGWEHYAAHRGYVRDR
jgi:hypothetical protein